MQRFFCPSSHISGDRIIIDDKTQVHHIRDVLRLKVKDEVTVFDDKGNTYNCIIEKVFKEVIFNIKDRHTNMKNSQTLRIAIACAVPKKSKMDDIVDKLTQLGVDRIIPLKTQRVIIKFDKNKETPRLQRWKKIALSASQQSQRDTLPVIESVKSLEEVLAEAKDYDLKLIPTITSKSIALKKILTQSRPKSILVLIGPEGDFTFKEIEMAKKAGCIPVSLGDLILRVETAAMAVTSFIRLYGNN